MSKFVDTEKTDVTKHIEKKGKFCYLSWPFAVSEFRKNYPFGVWDVYSSDKEDPVIKTEHGLFVKVIVTPDVNIPHISYAQLHPILDNNNNPIKTPNAFQVNTSIQRGIVKAIAIATGIGLHIYAGEDLPPGEEENEKKIKKAIDGIDNIEHLRNWYIKHLNEFKDAKIVSAICEKRKAEITAAFLREKNNPKPCPEGEPRQGQVMSRSECAEIKCPMVLTCPNWV